MIALALLAQLLSPAVSCRADATLGEVCTLSRAEAADRCQWVRHGQASREACEDLGGAWFDDGTCGGRDDAQERLCVALFGEE